MYKCTNVGKKRKKEEKVSQRTQNISESLANNSGFRSVLSKRKFICKFCWQESATEHSKIRMAYFHVTLHQS